MSLEGIGVPKSGYGSADQPWADDPRHGGMEADDIVASSRFLPDFTSTPDQYCFAVWDGYGISSAGGSVLVATSGGIPLLPPVGVENAQMIEGERWDCARASSRH